MTRFDQVMNSDRYNMKVNSYNIIYIMLIKWSEKKKCSSNSYNGCIDSCLTVTLIKAMEWKISQNNNAVRITFKDIDLFKSEPSLQANFSMPLTLVSLNTTQRKYRFISSLILNFAIAVFPKSGEAIKQKIN